MKFMIKDLGMVITGNTPSKSNLAFYESKDIGFVKPDIILDKEITRIEQTREYLAECARDKARIAPGSSLFVTCIGSIGKIGISCQKEYAFNQQINVIVPNSKIFPKYLAYCLQFNRNRLQNIANAPVVPIINKTQFENFEIEIVENIDEQKEITKVLDALGTLMLMEKNQLAEYDKLIKSRFVEMFGDPVINQLDWKQSSMDSVCKRITDGEHGSVPRTKSGYMFLNAKHIKADGSIDFNTATYINSEIHEKIYKRCNPEAGDILLTTTGTIGNVAIVPPVEQFSMDRGITLLKLDRTTIESVFMANLLRFESMQNIMNSNVHASAIGHLFLNKIMKLPVIIPPIELQESFTSFVEQADKLKLMAG